ncbi:MAG TPA: hypothetical protein VGK47_15020 [Nitrososphaeraceae archaeon]
MGEEVKKVFNNLPCNEKCRDLFGKMFGIGQYEGDGEAYEDCLKQYGYSECFPKNEARILFKTGELGIITDILVERFRCSEENQHLYQEYKMDIGNCLSDWDKWTLSDVLIKFFVFYGIHHECHIKALMELSKVREWRPAVAPWIYRWFN